MTRYAQQRIANPVYFFDAPDQVLTDEKLTWDEKQKVLQSMVVDAEQLVDATAEGMESPEPTYKAEDLRRALAQLGDTKDTAAPAADAVQNRSSQFKRIIVVTTARQDLNRVVLDHALDMADLSDGDVSLLNIVPSEADTVGSMAAMPMAGTVQGVRVDTSAILEDRKKLLADLRDTCGAGDAVEIEVRTGPIEGEIVAYAETCNADLIVVGSPNRSWLEGLFNPTLDRHVTRIAPCPVLVVPEPT
ncbi:universal stress protein [uncultured Tateyamaria sp.]|uniref:universal stress protein n=1 Tax=uncultured Tateyamaria sp. TaxID=455651 RepID=UPI00262A446C|nr:universal stress protein [uncultured Tateyamaria sp.]